MQMYLGLMFSVVIAAEVAALLAVTLREPLGDDQHHKA